MCCISAAIAAAEMTTAWPRCSSSHPRSSGERITWIGGPSPVLMVVFEGVSSQSDARSRLVSWDGVAGVRPPVGCYPPPEGVLAGFSQKHSVFRCECATCGDGRHCKHSVVISQHSVFFAYRLTCGDAARY